MDAYKTTLLQTLYVAIALPADLKNFGSKGALVLKILCVNLAAHVLLTSSVKAAVLVRFLKQMIQCVALAKYVHLESIEQVDAKILKIVCVILAKHVHMVNIKLEGVLALQIQFVRNAIPSVTKANTKLEVVQEHKILHVQRVGLVPQDNLRQEDVREPLTQFVVYVERAT
jgi:flagellar hook-basal body complex protein FliE